MFHVFFFSPLKHLNIIFLETPDSVPSITVITRAAVDLWMLHDVPTAWMVQI